MAPLGLQFDAPNKVSLYLIGDNCIIVENFNDNPVDVALDFKSVSDARKVLILPQDGTADISQNKNSVKISNLSPRALIAIEYHK